MKINEVIEKYQNVVKKDIRELFRHFPTDANVIVRTLEKGRVLLSEGSPTACVYVMLTGKLRLAWELPGRDKYVFRQDGPLNLIGDLAIMAQLTHYTTTVIAETECIVLSMTCAVFWEWMDQDRELFRNQVGANLRMILQQNDYRRSAAEHSSYFRILRYFRWYYQAYKDVDTERAIVKKTRDQIADEISLVSVRTVNRILTKMVESGVIEIKKGKVHISKKHYAAIQRELENAGIF